MSDDEPRPGTTAALDRRVEKLESQVAELVTGFAVMRAGQEAQKSTLDSVSVKLDRVLDAQALQREAASDPESTAAGRYLLREIAEARLTADLAKAASDKLALKVAAAGGAVTLLLLLVNLFAPLIRSLFSLPI